MLLYIISRQGKQTQITHKEGGESMIDYNIRSLINKEKMDNKGLLTELAKEAKHANTSTISKWLKDEKKEFDNLDSLLAIVKKMYPDNILTAIEHYSVTINVNKKVTRHLLEYLSCNRLLDAMRNLLDRMLQSDNDDITQWAKAYDLQHEYQANYSEVNKVKHLKKIRKLKANDPTLEVFTELMKCYMYYHNDNHQMAYEIAEEILDLLEEIEDGYVKRVYTVKLHEVYSYVNLWLLNDTEAARSSSYKVLEANIGETFNAYAYFTIGYSYFYTSFNKAEEFLSKSVSTYRSMNRVDAADDVERTIEKLEIFWEKAVKKEIYKDINNELYYKAKYKMDITSLLPLSIDEDLIGYKLFAEGLGSSNKDLLMQSMIRFLKQGSAFEACLPMLELIKLGEDQKTLQDLLNINSL